MKVHPIHKNLLQFDQLNKENALFTFTTTIEGGVSKGNYSSFNLGLFSGDDEQNVLENRIRLIANIGSPELYLPYQTHKTKIALVDQSFLSKTYNEKQHLLYGVDAVVTNQKNVCIGVGTADCVPILIYDPQNHVLAAVHAGWRGTVGRLPEKVITLMQSTFGSMAQDLLVGIGPAISQKYFEVGSEVIIAFNDAKFDLEKVAKKNQITHKYHIDLWLSNQLALEEKGVLKENIQQSNLCTFEKTDLFFSARRQTIYSGRMVTGGILL